MVNNRITISRLDQTKTFVIMIEKIKENSVVQITETGQEGWVGCLLQVSELKTWGVMGWVQIPMQGSAYLRVNFEDIEYIGEAVLTN